MADLFRNPNNKLQLNGPDLAVKNTINGMPFFNCGFKFQNATHADIIKKDEVWQDNLVEQ